ncbi:MULTISPECIES: prolyl aminopeptidase [Roseobacteraceae]|uniref:prolyl aminopeptidase n=1 Tax=Roseobacteraceae TaxID=2854170 RepID=UPI00125F421F|nr:MULTISPECIES: prolyl aminopeptidase [Roseobacteraceae]KAB6716559.1 prolyl aminopeptidase [Roseobacter sp. TSBP12]|tara:strand:- start:6222 stop:7199 length:978 start_codon:yes stop_codon:yes gene_type:complete
MDKVSGQKSAYSYLYPQIAVYDHRMLEVGDGHRIYVEQSGNPKGIPVVVFHGGPGGGCSPYMRRYFDPSIFRIILFDQRGCGKSRPFASVDANTTWHLVADVERIRVELGIERWTVFGGSWGATLGVAYTQSHPERVLHLVLRGVFLARQSELDWFYAGGAGQFWPELWAEFCDAIPDEEHDDLIAAYHRRLFSGTYQEELRFGRIWSRWENALASIGSNGAAGEPAPDYARTFARLENHYFTHKAFFERDGQLLEDIGKMANVPGTIVQGRFDMICPPHTAYALHKVWPKARLMMVGQAGHAMSEPGITQALVSTMDRIGQEVR